MVQMSVADKVTFDLALQRMPEDAVSRALRHFDVPEDAPVLSSPRPVDQTAAVARDRLRSPYGRIRSELGLPS